MEQIQKYPLNKVQALIFDDTKAARDFIAANDERIEEFSVQTINAPVVILFVWKS